MASGTLGPNDIQSAFITTLKADAPLIALVPAAQVREVNWMGDEYTYPAVRIDLAQMPFTVLNGNCYGQWFDIILNIYVFIEGTSSRQCGVIMKAIGQLLGLASVSSSLVRTQPLDINYVPPVPDGANSWRGQVIVSGRAKQLV